MTVDFETLHDYKAGSFFWVVSICQRKTALHRKRTAILCQETLPELRKKRTPFKSKYVYILVACDE